MLDTEIFKTVSKAKFWVLVNCKHAYKKYRSFRVLWLPYTFVNYVTFLWWSFLSIFHLFCELLFFFLPYLSRCRVFFWFIFYPFFFFLTSVDTYSCSICEPYVWFFYRQWFDSQFFTFLVFFLSVYHFITQADLPFVSFSPVE